MENITVEKQDVAVMSIEDLIGSLESQESWEKISQELADYTCTAD